MKRIILVLVVVLGIVGRVEADAVGEWESVY